LAAAGIVVTEMRTPVSAPDRSVVSESTPATPASVATMIENVFGSAMKYVAGRLNSGDRLGRGTEHAERKRDEQRDSARDREADGECDQGAPCERGPPLDDRDA
jgi:hypothetical protein